MSGQSWEKSKMTGVLILSDWEAGRSSDHFFPLFSQRWKIVLLIEKAGARSQHFCASSYPPKSIRGTQVVEMDAGPKGGGLGQERSPGPQPSKQQKSHRPILAVPRIGQLGQACCVHLDLCGGLSYRNCSASAIGEACRLTTQKEFSRTFPASGGCPSRHRSLKVHALDYLLGITGLNLFSFLGPNSTKLIFSSHDPYSWTLLATLRALVVFM